MQEETISAFVSNKASRLQPELSLHINVIAKTNEVEYEMPRTLGTRGRRKLAFEESSERSKRRNSKELRKIVGFPELNNGTTMSLLSAGKTYIAKLFIEALETTPTGALRIRKAWGAHAKNVSVPYTAEEELSLFIKAHLAKIQYTKIRRQAKCRTAISTQVTM